MTDDPVEVARCVGCGKLLRRRRRLTTEEAGTGAGLALRGGQFARDPSIDRADRRRKLRGVLIGRISPSPTSNIGSGCRAPSCPPAR